MEIHLVLTLTSMKPQHHSPHKHKHTHIDGTHTHRHTWNLRRLNESTTQNGSLEYFLIQDLPQNKNKLLEVKEQGKQ